MADRWSLLVTHLMGKKLFIMGYVKKLLKHLLKMRKSKVIANDLSLKLTRYLAPIEALY